MNGNACAVTLWGKPGCCLCDHALALLERLAREYPLRIEKRDITADPSAFERYRYVIPVVEIDGGERFEGKITEYRLRQALERQKT
ncbi:MAG TPA: glutaredoxin family protein [Chloroflexota bacterium]|nr:glutaredoxin family protein [Chloroflexota bacterium]